MKVPLTLVIYSSLPPVGGHSTITLKIIESFRNDFDLIHVLTRDLPGHGISEETISDLRSQGITVERIDENGRLQMPVLLKSLFHLRSKGVATFLCVGMGNLSPLVSKILKARRSVYYHITHTSDIEDFRRLAKISSAFDTMAVISPLSIEPLKQQPNFACEAVWIPQISELPDALLSPKTKNQSPLSFGFLGRLSQAKGVALLLDIWRSAPPAADLHLMGSGELESEVHDLVMATVGRDQGKVFYHGSFAASERDAALSKFFNKINWLCVPSIVEGEGLPTVILEAIQYGIPVLTTPIGGTACFALDWLRPDDPNVVILDQPLNLSQAIRSKIPTLSDAGSLAQSCRAYYQKWFSTEVVRELWKSALLK